MLGNHFLLQSLLIPSLLVTQDKIQDEDKQAKRNTTHKAKKISNRDPVLLKLTSVHPLKVIFALWSLILTYLPWATLVEAVAGSWHSNHCSITTRSISLWKYAALGWNNVKRLQPKVLVKVVIPMPAMLITEALSLTAQNIVLIPTTLIWSGSWTKWNNSWKSSENAFIDFK